MKLMHGHCQCIQLSNEGFGDTTDIISSGIQAVLLFVFARWTYQMNNKSFSLRNTVVSCFRSFDISRYIVLTNSYPKKKSLQLSDIVYLQTTYYTSEFLVGSAEQCDLKGNLNDNFLLKVSFWKIENPISRTIYTYIDRSAQLLFLCSDDIIRTLDQND